METLPHEAVAVGEGEGEDSPRKWAHRNRNWLARQAPRLGRPVTHFGTRTIVDLSSIVSKYVLACVQDFH